MKSSTREKIHSSAKELLNRFQTNDYRNLSRPYSTAIQIISALHKGGSIKELCNELNLHENTVFEYINALEIGGIRIKRKPINVEHSTSGRPELYFSLEAEIEKSKIKKLKIDSSSSTDEPKLISKETTKFIIGKLPPREHFQEFRTSSPQYPYVWQDVDTPGFRIYSKDPNPWDQEWIVAVGLQYQKADNSTYPYQCRLRLLTYEEKLDSGIRVFIFRDKFKGIFASHNLQTLKYYAFPLKHQQNIWVSYSFVLADGIYKLIR